MNLIRLDEFRLKLEKEGAMVTDAYIYANKNIKIENEAIRQLYNTASLGPVKRVLCTPDIHVGFGVPIGTVVGLNDAVIPSAVGYDINCGMTMLTAGIKYDEIVLNDLMHQIHNKIPLGEGKDNISFSGEILSAILRGGIRGLYSAVIRKSFKKLYPEVHRLFEDISPEYVAQHIEDNGEMPAVIEHIPERALSRGRSQFATLGGGNHFIEIQRIISIEDGRVAERWGLAKDGLSIMIHSGSRGFGHEIGGFFMRLAAEYDRRRGYVVPNSNLAYFDIDSSEGCAYINSMYAAANFAYVNRHLIFLIIRSIFQKNIRGAKINLVYDVPHNIAKYEKVGDERYFVHRKGATRAYPPSMVRNTIFADTGQPILIPGSMGTRSYLLVGEEGAIETLYSVNHGAGRVMSRSAASGKRRRGRVSPSLISDEEFRRSMEDIYLVCGDRSSIKEEAPAAYKDIDEVVSTVVGAGIARVVAIMKPIGVLKG